MPNIPNGGGTIRISPHLPFPLVDHLWLCRQFLHTLVHSCWGQAARGEGPDSDQKNMLLLSSSSRCLQMPLWPLLAAAALFGTWSGPQHMTLQSHTETGRRCLRAPPCRARPRAGAPCLSLTAVIPPVRTGTGAAGAVDARSCASMVHQMASATMAAREPSSQSAASAPTALTAALGRQLIFPLIWPRLIIRRNRPPCR